MNKKRPKSDPWTQEEVAEAVKRALNKGMPKAVTEAVTELVTTANSQEWTDAEVLEHLATAAVLEALAKNHQKTADTYVAQARDKGATWADVAQATGYSSSVSANQRFNPAQREAVKARVRKYSRRQRED